MALEVGGSRPLARPKLPEERGHGNDPEPELWVKVAAQRYPGVMTIGHRAWARVVLGMALFSIPLSK